MENEDMENEERKLIILPEIDSTSLYLKAHFKTLPDQSAVRAECQSAGRGRLGRSFISPPGVGIYLSILLKPAHPEIFHQGFTAMTAVALSNAVERVCGVRPGIKWPNDLVMDHKKIAGILTETVSDGEESAIIVGIGVNVNNRETDFPEELHTVAGSIQNAVGHPVSRERLTEEMLNEMDLLYRHAAERKAAFLELYLRDCVNIGERVRISDETGEREAEGVTVDEDYGLVVRYGDGRTETVRAGEVRVRGLYGYV